MSDWRPRIYGDVFNGGFTPPMDDLDILRARAKIWAYGRQSSPAAGNLVMRGPAPPLTPIGIVPRDFKPEIVNYAAATEQSTPTSESAYPIDPEWNDKAAQNNAEVYRQIGQMDKFEGKDGYRKVNESAGLTFENDTDGGPHTYRALGLRAESFTIEVTETVAMTDLGHSLETLARLRMKGFGLSIDDYGTGFSSMQQLTRVPVSELKIDQVFVTGSAKQDVLQALLGTSVTMAKRLKLRSVAEGVESEQDWQTVARLGCDVAQGFFIGRPMPYDELIGWYNTWMGDRQAVVPGE